MVKLTLGDGTRAKNGQCRRKSRFVPCGVCGKGTTFIVCVDCQGRIMAHNTKQGKIKAVSAMPEKMTEEQATNWLQMSLSD